MQEPEKSVVEPETNWKFNTSAGDGGSISGSRPGEEISWSASEYIAHDKSQNWYVVAGATTLLIAGIIFALDSNKSWFNSLLIIIAGGVFIAAAARKPRILDYSVNDDGIQVGPKLYGYAEFKSFSVIQEGAINSILLLPLKRFMPSLSVYYEPKDEAKIAELLGKFLPYEDRKQDAIERLMRKIGF